MRLSTLLLFVCGLSACNPLHVLTYFFPDKGECDPLYGWCQESWKEYEIWHTDYELKYLNNTGKPLNKLDLSAVGMERILKEEIFKSCGIDLKIEAGGFLTKEQEDCLHKKELCRRFGRYKCDFSGWEKKNGKLEVKQKPN